MKKLMLLLIATVVLSMGYSQKTHSFGFGLDASKTLSTPTAWNNHTITKHRLWVYPSINYNFRSTFFASVMFQNYWNRIVSDVIIDKNRLSESKVLFSRDVKNLDILLGVDVLSLIGKKNRGTFYNNSSVIVQIGGRYVFKNSYIKYATKHPRPEYHDLLVLPENVTIFYKNTLRFAAHINYSYKIYKGLHVNANLNYGYIFKSDNPFIGQLGLRYWF